MKTIQINEKILKKNEENADYLKKTFKKKNIFTVNVLGSPGAGKTSILEKVIENSGVGKNIAVIEGDLYTSRDAERLEKYGTQVVQVNTGGICHLEANMIRQVVDKLKLEEVDLLFIENVGNLVCTAAYNLGEDIKMTVLSVPEGSDKLLKYPQIFQKAELMLINKIDLINYTNFSYKDIKNDLKQMNKDIQIFKISCKTNNGIQMLCNYLEEKSSHE